MKLPAHSPPNNKLEMLEICVGIVRFASDPLHLDLTNPSVCTLILGQSRFCEGECAFFNRTTYNDTDTGL
jgi:hypothetical protein